MISVVQTVHYCNRAVTCVEVSFVEQSVLLRAALHVSTACQHVHISTACQHVHISAACQHVHISAACQHVQQITLHVCRDTVILRVILYGCETWSLTLREELMLRVFENGVLRRMFGARRDEVAG